MAKIKIYYAGVAAADQILRQVIEDLFQLAEDLTSIQAQWTLELRPSDDLAARLTECRVAAEEMGFQAKRLLYTVEKGVELYQRTEGYLQRIEPQDR